MVPHPQNTTPIERRRSESALHFGTFNSYLMREQHHVTEATKLKPLSSKSCFRERCSALEMHTPMKRLVNIGIARPRLLRKLPGAEIVGGAVFATGSMFYGAGRVPVVMGLGTLLTGGWFR
ncbi:hypothetical protein RSAG8_05700, partial [Rhizoctonia solani AG-8 WAC10335]